MERLNWSNQLYDGLVTSHGAPTKIAAGMITKPNYEKQISEPFAPSLEVVSDNSRHHRIGKKPKQSFSVHRSISFLPQE